MLSVEKSTGIVRKIDELGRVVLPSEMRKTLGLPEGTPVDIASDGERIILTKYCKCCTFCGSMDNLISFRDHYVCNSCKGELYSIAAKLNQQI